MAQNSEQSKCLCTRWTVTTAGDCPVYLIGSTPELGEWNTENALPMHVHRFGHRLNNWNIELALPRGQTSEFKFIQKDGSRNVLWEKGGNRVFTAEGPEAAIHWGTFR